MTPILSLTLIDPQQAVAHRHAVVRRPQIGGPPELAVPRMRKLMRYKRACVDVLVPFREVGRHRAVLARPVMFQPDAAHAVAEGKEEVVMIVMTRTKELVGLRYQGAVRVEMLGFCFQKLRPVG